MNDCIEHTESAQAAEFAAARKVQAVTWAGLEWWNHSQGCDLVAIERDAAGFGCVRQVGTIFSATQSAPTDVGRCVSRVVTYRATRGAH